MGGHQLALRVPSGFLLDWHSLRVGGLICAGVLCAVGIIVLMSEWRRWQEGGQGRAVGPFSRPFFLPQQVGNANASSAGSPGEMGSRCVSASCWTDTFQG